MPEFKPFPDTLEQKGVLSTKTIRDACRLQPDALAIKLSDQICLDQKTFWSIENAVR